MMHIRHTRGVSYIMPDRLALDQAMLDSLRSPMRATGYICPDCKKHCLAYVAANGELRITCNCPRCECGEKICKECGGCTDSGMGALPTDSFCRQVQCSCVLCTDCGELYNPDTGHSCSRIETNYRERAAFDELNAGVM